MNYIFSIVISAIIHSSIRSEIILSSEPTSSCYASKSTKTIKDNPQFILDRIRSSTCTGVDWFHKGDRLISINLLQSSFQTYRFNPNTSILSLQPFQNHKYNTKLDNPENLSFSKDGTLLAVSNSAKGNVTVYNVNTQTSNLDITPIAFIGTPDDIGIHGVRFSPDGHYLGYVTYDSPGKIKFFRIHKTQENQVPFSLSQSLINSLEPLAPKGLDFSYNGCYVAICYSKRASSHINENSGLVVIYKFDRELGLMDPNPICQIGIEQGLSIPEDLRFYPDDSCLLVSNQGNDTITIHDFDPKTGKIEKSYLGLKNPKACLSFPHGFSISPDGQYLAVSNYGNNKVNIYSITKQ